MGEKAARRMLQPPLRSRQDNQSGRRQVQSSSARDAKRESLRFLSVSASRPPEELLPDCSQAGRAYASQLLECQYGILAQAAADRLDCG